MVKRQGFRVSNILFWDTGTEGNFKQDLFRLFRFL